MLRFDAATATPQRTPLSSSSRSVSAHKRMRPSPALDRSGGFGSSAAAGVLASGIESLGLDERDCCTLAPREIAMGPGHRGFFDPTGWAIQLNMNFSRVAAGCQWRDSNVTGYDITHPALVQRMREDDSAQRSSAPPHTSRLP